VYGKESDEAKKAKDEVDKLTEEHKKSEKAVEANAKQTQNYQTNLNKASAEMVKTQGELRKVNGELDKSNNKWLQTSETLKKSSDRLTDTGGKITDVGKSITTKMSVPLAGLGVVAVKTTADYNDSMSQLKAVTNSSTEDMEKLNKQAKAMGIQTRYSAKEAADSMVGLGQAGYNTNEILNTTPAVLNLAQAGAIDLTQSTDILVSSMSQFGIATEKAGHVADVLSLGANKANLGVGDLGESLKYCGAMANTAGWSLEDVTAAISLMSNYGIKGSQAGTILRGSISRLIKPSEDAAETMSQLGIKAFDSTGKMKPLPAILDEINKKTANLTQQQKMNTLVTLFGQEAVTGMNALLKEGGNSLRSYSKELKNADGSAKKTAGTMEDNLGGSMRSLKSAMEGAAISMGTALTPTIKKLTEHLTELTRKFAELSPKTQETIAKLGMFVVAVGPAIIITGELTTGLGSITKGLSKFIGFLGKTAIATKGATAAAKGASVATGVASKGVKATGLAVKAGTALLNPWTIGIAAAGAGIVALHKHLSKEAVPSVDLFNSKVKTTTQTTDAYGNKIDVASTKTVKFADSTKKAVGGFVELNNGAKKNLTDLYVNSTKITDKTAKTLTDKYKQMGDQIKAGEDAKYKERLASFKAFLGNNKTMSDKDKADSLKSMEDAHNKEKAEVDKYVKQIQTIANKASKEGRALTKEDQEQINAIQEKMKTEGVKKLSKTEEESKIILGRMKEYDKRITAEQASEVIKNAEKQRKGTVDKANQQYNQTVATIKKMRDEDKTITKDQADKMIAEAERQKKRSIDKAEQQKDGVVGQIKEMDSNSLQDIDITDGRIMTKWDKLRNWFKDNPITRWIKTKTSNSDASAGGNWTGTNYWQGGLTYLHDAPGRNSNYELYDLPRGTRIYNHDASADLVMQTAEQVATKVAGNMLNKSNSKGKIEVIQHIYCPVPTPSELARQSKNNLKELGLQW
jgi:TP901 family phage tail tape measure protein